MIKELYIRNYALIKELQIEFEQGLNIITGETGAGKSIILGALGLILGNRADSKGLDQLEQKCVIEGHFDISTLELRPLFEAHDLDYEEETILRREISPNGKSRAFVNDIPVTLTVLREVGLKLVDIHSQHSNLLLKDEGFRRNFIDLIAQNHDSLKAYQQTYMAWRMAEKELEALKKEEAELRATADYNRFQWEEIDTLKLEPGEYEENERELDRLNNSEKIHEAFTLVTHTLEHHEPSVLAQLTEVKAVLQRISSFDPAIKSIYERIESSLIDLNDVSEEVDGLKDSWTFDEDRLQTLNEKQELAQRLMRKHQVSDLDALLEKGTSFKKSFERSDHLDTDIEELSKLAEENLAKLVTQGNGLSQQRVKAAAAISKNMEQTLKQLGIPDAQFEIAVISDAEKPHKFGVDQTQFLFSANKGMAKSDVSKVASGGEISRIMLALKTMMSDSSSFPTLIFDEIDLGVSGEVAIKMGHMIQRLSQRHQVVSITHLPQIAAMGSAHFRVKKVFEKDRSYSTIEPLHPDDRITEIGQMIGGMDAGASAIESAKELLQKFATSNS